MGLLLPLTDDDERQEHASRRVLDRPLCIDLELGEHIISFKPGDRDFLSDYHLLHPDAEGCLARARDCGLVTDDCGFVFTGVRICLSTN